MTSAMWTSHEFWKFVATMGLALVGIGLLVLFGVALGAT